MADISEYEAVIAESLERWGLPPLEKTSAHYFREHCDAQNEYAAKVYERYAAPLRDALASLVESGVGIEWRDPEPRTQRT